MSQQCSDKSPAVLNSHDERDTKEYSDGQLNCQAARDDASNYSRHSSSSTTSKSSSLSILLASKRAKAERARAAATFAKKEVAVRIQQLLLEEKEKLSIARLRRERQELDTDLYMLEQEKEVAVAEAELQALETLSTADKGLELPLPAQEPEERTSQYIAKLTRVEQHTSPLPDQGDPHMSKTLAPPLPSLAQEPQKTSQYISKLTQVEKHASPLPDQGQRHMSKTLAPPNNYCQPKTAPYTKPDPQGFMYNHTTRVCDPVNSNETAVTSELSKFLLRKELLFSRLTTYDDKPESYSVWKSSFQSVIIDLQLSPTEETELLIKWLGKESSRHARALRSANVYNPEKALYEIWRRLDERFGASELVERSIRDRISNFPRLSNKDHKLLYELADLASEINSLKQDDRYRLSLSSFDSSSGVNTITRKLPYGLQEKWVTVATKYKLDYDVQFPPFEVFVEFLHRLSKTKNDPSFFFDNSHEQSEDRPKRRFVATKKTGVGQSHTNNNVENKATLNETQVPSNPAHSIDVSTHCPIHLTRHTLNDCRSFRAKSVQDRNAFIQQNRICFKCCASNAHIAKACSQSQPCKECGSKKHATALHLETSQEKSRPDVKQDGESSKEAPANVLVGSKCTQICGGKYSGKSCAKTILVNIYHKTNPEKSMRVYAILDDQSNASLAKSSLFDELGVHSSSTSYTLSSCAGAFQTFGRRASGYIVEAIDRSTSLELPSVLECDEIPNFREEIPTPDVAHSYPHLKDIEHAIHPIEEKSQILLLIGRDLPEAHHVLDQRTGQRNTPYAQKLPLGWVIVGESCLGITHETKFVRTSKTYILQNGRPSSLEPCPNSISIKHPENSQFGDRIFQGTKEDDKPGLSVEDKQFLHIMENQTFKDTEGHWVSPLPFREPRPRLPNNRQQAVKRALMLKNSLLRNSVKRKHMTEFMQRLLDDGHAELAPPLKDDEEQWYLPVFGVYHPRKPDQIRAVFDSSAKFEGLSLNNVLLTGPDLTNNLTGVLLRFRRENVAVMGDVQQMFYCFRVREDHRKYLRFLWHKNNDPNQELLEYCMRVHVFGNSPSPAVATYGLHLTAQIGKSTFGEDVQQFVTRNFYVDDGLASFPSADTAIDLMTRAQLCLKSCGGLRLHKITSNSLDVMSAFPSEDLAKGLKDFDFTSDLLPLQRSLGLVWDLTTDAFTFRVSYEEKTYTRRGILSTVNSLFDPLGFLAPVTIEGKTLVRALTATTKDWDESLPTEYQDQWKKWTRSLKSLERFQVPRKYSSVPMAQSAIQELHVFSDASEKAIAAVAYLKTIDENKQSTLGYVFGKAKLAPTHGHTIPRLELCAAVLAVEVADFVSEHLDTDLDSINFYTDSKIVLGYIHNSTRRFFRYVANRVERIHHSSDPSQWKYVHTASNPADDATRSVPANLLGESAWIRGPPFLTKESTEETEMFSLAEPEQDVNDEPDVMILTTHACRNTLGSDRFTRFSTWKSLIEAILILQHIARSFSKTNQCRGWHICSKAKTVQNVNKAEKLVIKIVQRETYPKEIKCLQDGTSLPRNSPLLFLNPVMDENDGLIRIGGRLSRSGEDPELRQPIILPGQHHVAVLMVRKHHERVQHQGRHYTEAAIREGGYWITGAKRLVSSVTYKCVTCRRLRRKPEQQKMADLPAQRVQPSAPFTYVGVDCFGPWTIVTRKSRGGTVNSKRWAALFTCLSTRAVHIEVIEEMTSSSFVNALRRFVSIRGKVAEFLSDRGTNFVGATDDLKVDVINVEDGPVRNFVYNSGTIWKFNAPHSSHMGGVWERMIGLTRRILDAMLLDCKVLTHEVLVTFMAEVSTIINARPIVPISTDPEAPEMLTPSALLTQKVNQTPEPLSTGDMKDMYRAHWKRVQALADTFWKKWKKEYLHTLQKRQKWPDDQPNIKNGDVVLLMNDNLPRNEWPTGVVTSVLPGEDGRVRKAVVRIIKDSRAVLFTRPITEIILLVST